MSEIETVYRCKVLETLSWLYFETEPKRQFAVVEMLYPAAAYEVLQKENAALKQSNLELERLCDRTYVQQGADAYNHCCEVFESWRVKRQKLDFPTHDWSDGLYNSLNWLQDTIEELEAENEAQAKRLEEAVNRIKDMLENDDGQAHKESRKFLESLAESKNGDSK